jgi:hypothetical protein
MKIHNVEQGTDEWHKLRLGKFTASDGQAIATNGKGLETLCFEKVAEIFTGKTKDPYTNADMERGKELEEMARNSYEIETGIVVKRIGFVELTEYIGCSPDGTIGEDGLQEIKCKNDANYARYAFERKIDKDHYWQMQMQMYCMDRKWCDYVVFNPNFVEKSIIIERVERNDEEIKKLIEGLEKGTKFVEEVLQKITIS